MKTLSFLLMLFLVPVLSFSFPALAASESDRSQAWPGQWLCPFRLANKYGLVNAEARIVAPPVFDQLYDFSPNGLAAVAVDGKYGFINEKGEIVIAVKFDYAGPFAANGLARVQVDSKWGFINTQGEIAIGPKFEFVGDFGLNGLAAFRRKSMFDKFGYIDHNGEIVIKPSFNFANKFNDDGLARVEIKGKKSYINSNGEVAIKTEMAEIRDFAPNGLAAVKSGKASAFRRPVWGFINRRGEIVIEAKYAVVSDFAANGLAMVSTGANEPCAFINASGETVIKSEFGCAGGFNSHGLAWFSRGGLFGLMNEAGQIVMPADTYYHVLPFAPNGLAMVNPLLIEEGRSDGRMIAANNNENWRLIDTAGQVRLREDKLCGNPVLRNGQGDIVWPEKSQEEICSNSKQQ